MFECFLREDTPHCHIPAAMVSNYFSSLPASLPVLCIFPLSLLTAYCLAQLACTTSHTHTHTHIDACERGMIHRKKTHSPTCPCETKQQPSANVALNLTGSIRLHTHARARGSWATYLGNSFVCCLAACLVLRVRVRSHKLSTCSGGGWVVSHVHTCELEKNVMEN
ncbi:hypothetical protein IWX49DRAFT_337742 [Phyllosticta citricarpa]|uniref:Uncharacterized protein n=2 Tax=Phyllosticta TaxID=121621 RepID=A0ABR1MC13_9PEZI